MPQEHAARNREHEHADPMLTPQEHADPIMGQTDTMKRCLSKSMGGLQSTFTTWQKQFWVNFVFTCVYPPLNLLNPTDTIRCL